MGKISNLHHVHMSVFDSYVVTRTDGNYFDIMIFMITSLRSLCAILVLCEPADTLELLEIVPSEVFTAALRRHQLEDQLNPGTDTPKPSFR